jgi:hypothetical protein
MTEKNQARVGRGSRRAVPNIEAIKLRADTAPLAFLVRAAITGDEVQGLHREIGEDSRADILLAKRWKLWAVFTTPHWAKSMVARDTAPRGTEHKVVSTTANNGGPVTP